MELSSRPVMLLLISFIPVTQGRREAVVSIKPDTHVFIGEKLTLRCDVQGGGDTQWTYGWYKNNYRLFPERTRQEFTIWSVEDSDSGNYTCRERGIVSQSSEISDAVTLTVSVRPKPTVRVNPRSSIYTGDPITLSCEVQHGTKWQFDWYKNNHRLQNLYNEQENTLNVTVSNAGETAYRCRAYRSNYYYYYFEYSYLTKLSDPVKITARERPGAVLSVSPQSWLTEGDSVTLSCEVTDSSTDWTFSWYTIVTFTQNDGNVKYKPKLLTDSSRGSGGNYALSPAAFHHTGVYLCRGERGEPAIHTNWSNLQPVWITGESPPVALIFSSNRTQHFTEDSLSLSCEDQSNSTGWTVRRYTHSLHVSDCSQWGSVTGSTCYISSLSTSYTGVYRCESESGESSNPVSITVQDGDVIVESPVHPVTEGHPLTLRCLYRNPMHSNLRADFYKDGSVLQKQTTAEMILKTVSKSDEGFYYCKHPERGESPKSWISIRVSGSPSGSGTVAWNRVAVGLSFTFLLIVLLIVMAVLWCCKTKKGEAAAASNESTYVQVKKKKKANRNNDVEADLSVDDVTYAQVQIKPKKKSTPRKGTASAGEDTVYSALKLND